MPGKWTKGAAFEKRLEYKERKSATLLDVTLVCYHEKM